MADKPVAVRDRRRNQRPRVVAAVALVAIAVVGGVVAATGRFVLSSGAEAVSGAAPVEVRALTQAEFRARLAPADRAVHEAAAAESRLVEPTTATGAVKAAADAIVAATEAAMSEAGDRSELLAAAAGAAEDSATEAAAAGDTRRAAIEALRAARLASVSQAEAEAALDAARLNAAARRVSASPSSYDAADLLDALPSSCRSGMRATLVGSLGSLGVGVGRCPTHEPRRP
ncbi:MAG: hypothetical protein ACE5EV_00805 [Gaiellales bacterium]